ncbi:uncharacterized protein CTRU02_213312 [Colletotrichum truncatum]|uniref:Uncharacterized protein n=1 Tax=Colletotrichum truncatum TaxID=5467 RepID=A0ACC3YKD4_COLTU|nr:uncharacterized protein CTRU02_12692 [Colletotrichum truncatum]KAF6784429.1 hypothetical protein CTRU02_12692 [Colletotrichum truncatum]
MHIFLPPVSLQPSGGLLDLSARQDDSGVHVITQTIRRPTTTFVTYVTLGPGEPTPIPGNDTPEPPPAVTPAVAAPPPSRGSGSLSSVQIGAILGGVVAFVAIGLIAWYCMMVNNERRRYYYDMYDYDDSTTTSQYTASPIKSPPRPFFRPPVRPPSRRSSARYSQPPPPPPQPAPPGYKINQHPPWNLKFNGPTRTQRPHSNPKLRTAQPLKRPSMNGPRRVERPQQYGWNESRWTWNG